MPVLHFGVIDLPYVQKPRANQKSPTAGTVTTGDVAGWLEDEYHIMEIYSVVHRDDIVTHLLESGKGALENMMMGAPPSTSPWGAGVSKIEEGFHEFIQMGEMDRLGYPGVPTQAARDRALGLKRSNRKTRARASNAKPVSFYDSGLYDSSFKAWID